MQWPSLFFMTLSTILRNTLNCGAAAGAATAIGLLTVPAAQANNFTVGDLKTPDFAFTLTDKTFSDFGDFVGFNDADTVTFTLAGGVHRFQILSNGGWATPVGLDYKVAVTSGPSVITAATANYQTSDPAGAGNFTFTTGQPSTSTGSSTVNSSPLMNTFTPSVTSSTFSTTLTPTSGVIDQFTSRYIQSDVPGPLPILGIGAAFGFSRKLRKRIKHAA
jgi:hypothetical protein